MFFICIVNPFLKVSDACFFPFEQPVKFQIWFILVEKNHLSIDIFSCRRIKVTQEVGDTKIKK